MSTTGRDLCEAAAMTVRHHADEVSRVADCGSCDVPMVVWRQHGPEPPPAERDHMLSGLEKTAAGTFGDNGYWVDPVMRQVPRHYAHARQRLWRDAGGEQTGAGGGQPDVSDNRPGAGAKQSGRRR